MPNQLNDSNNVAWGEDQLNAITAAASTLAAGGFQGALDFVDDIQKGEFKNIKFNHDKFSLSKHKTLRGIHCDFKSWKMITCIYGKFLLVVVDMRKNSKNGPTFGHLR